MLWHKWLRGSRRRLPPCLKDMEKTGTSACRKRGMGKRALGKINCILQTTDMAMRDCVANETGTSDMQLIM